MNIRKSAFRILIAALLATAAFGQTAPRAFDSAAPAEGRFRLTVFYPSLGTIQDILALKEKGLLPIPDLEVVGVHHARERTNYAASEKFVKDKGLSWIHFHALTAEIGPETLYKSGPVSEELRRIFDLSDGVVFFGGPDIVPSLYGEPTSLLTVIDDPFRHYIELAAVFQLIGGSQDPAVKPYLEARPDFPVLGICLGMQTLNVGAGGTMIQDVRSESYFARTYEDVIALGPANWHTNPYPRLHPLERGLIPYMLHPIKFREGARIPAALGLGGAERPYIMSAHHQAVEKLGRGLRIAATSLDDRIVEALEHERFPNVLGVQFHPEFRMLWETEPRYKVAPGDAEAFACRTFLEAHPPSFDFHKKLWAWFFGKLNK